MAVCHIGSSREGAGAMDNQISQEKSGNRALKTPALPQRIGIVGLGLIGGSLARSFARHGSIEIVALDRNRAAIEQALSDKVLVQGAVIRQPSEDLSRNPAEESDAWQLLEACQIVFICTPVETVVAYVNQAARFCSGLITDVASVKQPIMEQVQTERFIGGHPMAGSERHGYTYASDTLFENAIYVLCIQPDSPLPISQLSRLEQLIHLIGATPLSMPAASHDRAVAAVSHLPHVVAAALSLLAARTDSGDLSRLAAGGFRDITRIASSSPGLWAGICSHSKNQLSPLLGQIIDLLDDFRDALQQDDSQALERFFFQAAQYRNALPADGRGALAAQSSLTVYIADKPGELGRVTTLLGERGINISNVRIKEYRAYEGGCLQILIASSAQAVDAAWILREAGYVCD